MQIGMIGLGRMGGNIVRRLMKHGHTTVVYDKDPKAVAAIAAEGAAGAGDAGRLRPQTREAARRLGDAAGRQDHRSDDRGSLEADGARRRHHRWRQHVLAGRRPPRQGAKGARHPLRRRRHFRRRVGHRARLLHDDRRRQGGGRSSRSDFRGAGARHRRYSAHCRSRRTRSPHRARLSPCRARSAPDIS